MTDKIIIENRSETRSMLELLPYIESVMRQGRISNNGTQYSYIVAFHCTGKLGVEVHSYKNKESDRFVIFDSRDRY